MTTPKLTKEKNIARKSLRDMLPRGSSMAYSEDTGFTLLLVPDGSVTRMFTAVASMTETKFRRKVGEYQALERWSDHCDGITQWAALPGKDWHAADVMDNLQMVPSWVWDNIPEDSVADSTRDRFPPGCAWPC